MQIEAIAGPALKVVSQNDDAAVRALFTEQRGLLEVVRQNRIWQWLGGVPSGFGRPSAGLISLYLAFGFVVLLAVAFFVAGFTQGITLWIVTALAFACLLVRPFVHGSAIKKTLALFECGVLLPAIVVHVEDKEYTDDDELSVVAVLVGMNVQSSDDLRSLVVAGGRLRDYVDGDELTPRDLKPLVQSIRERASHDGGRVAAPSSIGKDYEIAYLVVNPLLLPGEVVDSQLMFVFADPNRRDADHTRVVQSELWGNGAAGLCNALPLEEIA
tara:strand:- start:56164 stop:56976 length:813 start_codon:yes stop_codon:yes gene_type:complete